MKNITLYNDKNERHGYWEYYYYYNGNLKSKEYYL